MHKPATWVLPVVLGVWSAGAAGCRDLEERVDISYDDRHTATRLDVYMPADAPPPGGRPAVMLVHGGGWRSFHRDVNTEQAKRIADAGYVTINIDYRLVPDGTYPAAVQDVLCALSFTRAHATEWGIDPVRIAAWGYSAGGHLVSLIGVAPDLQDHQPDCASGPTGPPAAVISGAGPQNMHDLPQVDAVIEFMDGTPEQQPRHYDAASPVLQVRAGAPPFLLVHGDDDWFVDVDQSTRMRDRLHEVGTEASMLEIPGGGHLANRGPGGRYEFVISSLDTPDAWLAELDFLERTLGAP